MLEIPVIICSTIRLKYFFNKIDHLDVPSINPSMKITSCFKKFRISASLFIG